MTAQDWMMVSGDDIEIDCPRCGRRTFVDPGVLRDTPVQCCRCGGEVERADVDANMLLTMFSAVLEELKQLRALLKERDQDIAT